MRYVDAAHVDLGSFYARLPRLGKPYRLLGYAACIGAAWWISDPSRLAVLLIVAVIAWLMAWFREVGALWRAPLVAAIAMCAVILTAERLGHPLVPAPSVPASSSMDRPGSRHIEIRYEAPSSESKP